MNKIFLLTKEDKTHCPAHPIQYDIISIKKTKIERKEKEKKLKTNTSKRNVDFRPLNK